MFEGPGLALGPALGPARTRPWALPWPCPGHCSCNACGAIQIAEGVTSAVWMNILALYLLIVYDAVWQSMLCNPQFVNATCIHMQVSYKRSAYAKSSS